MDRELLLLLLVLLLCGPTLVAFGWWPAGEDDLGDALRLERRRWRRLWVPLLPALVGVGVLAGWAVMEPDAAEPLPSLAVLVATALALIPLRALCRAIFSMAARTSAPVMTVGLWRPHIVFSPALRAVVDDEVAMAIWEHEAAHLRHRDPLRIWLGQLATDLQWPWPQARRRFESWLEALELARDDEARRHGADGLDLSAGILAAASFHSFGSAAGNPAVAALLHRPSLSLRRRMDRLFASLSPEPVPSSRWPLWLVVGALFFTALVFGLSCGESLLHALLASR